MLISSNIFDRFTSSLNLSGQGNQRRDTNTASSIQITRFYNHYINLGLASPHDCDFAQFCPI